MSSMATDGRDSATPAPAAGATEAEAEKARPSPLNEKIRRIATDPGLSVEERTRKIQKLYSQTWSSKPTQNAAAREDAREVAIADGVNVVMGTPLGLAPCTHYARQCSIVASCCGKVFPCRLCHDEHVQGHQIDRFATQKMICRSCRKLQDVGAACANPTCSWRSSHYFCGVCRLWSDDANKDIFHCDGCGICRAGKRADYRHCEACRLCLPPSIFANHVCVDSSNDCAACSERLQDSTRNVVLLRCGHALHSVCQNRLFRSNRTTCPLCRVSLCDPEEVEEVSREWQAVIASQPMPEAYANVMANIHCDDCNIHSEVPYHFLGHICPSCRSLNTVVLSRTRLDENAADDAPNASTAQSRAQAFAGMQDSNSSSGASADSSSIVNASESSSANSDANSDVGGEEGASRPN